MPFHETFRMYLFRTDLCLALKAKFIYTKLNLVPIVTIPVLGARFVEPAEADLIKA